MATERRSHALSAYSSIHVYADETQVDIANNRSYISTELWIKGSSYSAYNVDCNVTGGGGYTNSHLTANGWVQLVSGGFWAPHNADGTGSATVGSYYSSGYGSMPYGEFTLTLSTIPRASQPSINTYPNNSPDITAGVACTIHMNKHANFTHKVSYSFGKKSGVIATGVVDNCSWTPPTSLLDQIGTATVGYGGISVETYSGSTKIGETKTCNFNLHVPNDSNPIIGDISLVEQHAGVKEKNDNVTVQQISRKFVSVPVTAKYSTRIKSVVCDGVALTNNNGTYTGYISNKSNGTYKVTATDSRGLQSSNTVTQPFYEYAKPFITATLKRESETSSKGTLSVSGSYSTILSNTLSMTIQRNDSSSPTTVLPSLSNGNISYSKSYTDLNYVQNFTIKVKVTDGFGESTEATAVLGVGQYALWMGKYNVKVGGKLNVGSDLTVGGSATINGSISTQNEISAALFRYKGASPASHLVGEGVYYGPKSTIKTYADSQMRSHRFTDIYVFDPVYTQEIKDSDGFKKLKILKRGMYLIRCRVQGASVSGNSSVYYGFTINAPKVGDGQWGWDQYDTRYTPWACSFTTIFTMVLSAGDVILWQIANDVKREVEGFDITLVYLTDQ